MLSVMNVSIKLTKNGETLIKKNNNSKKRFQDMLQFSTFKTH